MICRIMVLQETPSFLLLKKQILLFSVSKEQEQKISDFCATLGIDVLTIEKKDYARPLGSFLGISEAPSKGGKGKNGSRTQSVRAYRMTGFPSPMMVFCNVEQEDLDAFLSGYAGAGIEKIPLKAVLTPHNVSWTCEQLYEELMEEHRSFNR